MSVWVLVDDRIGSNNQSIAIAEQLSKNYVIKNIKYNCFIKIPNFIRQNSLLGIDLKNSDNIFEDLPDIVICAGRRLSSLALNIKKRNNNKTFIINIMDPNLNYTKFDLVILPKHDCINKKYENIIETYGSLNRINKDKIESEIKIWENKFINYKRSIISFIIGGDTKNYNFDLDNFKEAFENIINIVKNMDGFLCISSSRRTSQNCINIIKNTITKYKFDKNCYFYNWKDENGNNNPYYALLGVSDFIITTADSISMISESCSTGKPVYVYIPNTNLSKKHFRFYKDMLNNNYIKEFNKDTSKLEEYSYTPLNEVLRVVKIIKNKYKGNL